ncbi:MAG: DUF3108 domain-containing protein [Nitrospirota bacterium]
MSVFRLVGGVASLLVIASGIGSSAFGTSPVPFGHGERLVYSIGWYNVVGGTATLDVDEAEYQGVPVYRVRSLAKSNAFVSVFFPVEDRIESLIDRDTLSALRLDVKQRQGKRKRDRVTEFDQVNHTATVVKNGQQKVFEIPPDVQDSLSCLYYFRSLPAIRVGETVTIDVHESNKNWRLGIEAQKRERIRTEAGEFMTIRVKAKVEFEGVFLDRGDVYVWFTDDERRLPVRMDSQIKVGRISAKLIKYRPPASVEARLQ